MLWSLVALLCSLGQAPLPVLRGTPDGDPPIDPIALAFQAPVRAGGVQEGASSGRSSPSHRGRGWPRCTPGDWWLTQSCWHSCVPTVARSSGVTWTCLHRPGWLSLFAESRRRRPRSGGTADRVHSLTNSEKCCPVLRVGRAFARSLFTVLMAGALLAMRNGTVGRAVRHRGPGSRVAFFIHRPCTGRSHHCDVRGWFPLIL